MRLRAEVVDLGGLDLGDNVDEIGAVAQVAVVQLELSGVCIAMKCDPISIDLIDSRSCWSS